MAESSAQWQGIPRDRIDWAPEIDEGLCIGCVTCGNLCPQRAIGFPPVSYIAHLIKENHVLVEAKRELEEMRTSGDGAGQK